MTAEQNNSFSSGGFRSNNGGGGGGGYGSASGPSKRKWGWHHGASPDHTEGCSHVKLYVVPVSRTATEADIRPVFEEYGNLVEVVILKDKRTGLQQGSCFVKYATLDEADRAIKALNNQYTFPGEAAPLMVKYADGERERFVWPPQSKGPGSVPAKGVVDKLYVGCLNREASNKEIEEIFSPYGLVEDVYIVRDELKQSRGCGFVKFSQRDMALAAIKALNGTFIMRGCDQPLIVRFADPKKPRIGEPRGNHVFGSTNFVPFSQEPFARPAPNIGDSMGGCIMPNHSYPQQSNSISSQPQAVSQMANLEPVMQQPFPRIQQSPSQLSQMPLQQIQTPQTSYQSSQLAVPQMQRQLHQTEKVEQQLNMQSPHTGSNPQTVARTSTSPAEPVSPQAAAPLECDWSEHTCPDGHKYYYNCVTCESRWKKPEEFTLYEHQLQNQQKLQNPSHQPASPLPVLSTHQVAQTQQELERVQLDSETSRVIGPTCV